MISDSQGQLGQGNLLNSSAPVFVATDAMDIVSGWKTSAIIHRDGKLFMFGANGCGQAGIGTFQDSPVPTAAQFSSPQRIVQGSIGQLHTLWISIQGKVFGTGCTANGRLGMLLPNSDYATLPVEVAFFNDKHVVHLSCGYTHSMY